MHLSFINICSTYSSDKSLKSKSKHVNRIFPECIITLSQSIWNNELIDLLINVFFFTLGYTLLRLNMNFDDLLTENLVLNIVKDKLRHNENVLSVCDCVWCV